VHAHLEASPHVHTAPSVLSTAEWLLPHATDASSDASTGTATGVGAVALS
jgi:hypothetical protein